MRFAAFRKNILNTVGAPAVRQRYILTRRNTLRLRYVAISSLGVLILAAGIGGPVLSRLTAGAPEQVASLDSAPGMAAQNAVAPAVVAVAPQALLPRDKMVKIGRGDTLNGVLVKAGVSSNEAFNAVEALKPYYNPRSITPGQKLALHFEPAADNSGYNFSRLSVALDPLSTVHLSKTNTGAFQASLDKKDPVRRIYARKANIDLSLYGAAAKAHIPSSVIANAIRVYSWNVDFQRDIQPGDTMEVMYEQFESPDGAPIRTGDIVYAKLTVNGRDMPIYRYQPQGGDADYFTPNGSSIRKALLSTPVDGARVSSGFGMRLHPVLGFTKLHKGIDFAAPIGTPIYAAGNGTIEKIGPFSSFGNYVRIRHNATLKTAYAHMLRFAANLRDGSRVKQGEVIGYIGVTGRSTGPHLHYEVLINNQQVNPRGVKVAQGDSLSGPALRAFKAHVKDIDQRYVTLLADKFASAAGIGDTDRLR